VNQEESEQNEVDGMKKGDDSTGEVMHTSAFDPHGVVCFTKNRPISSSARTTNSFKVGWVS